MMGGDVWAESPVDTQLNFENLRLQSRSKTPNNLQSSTFDHPYNEKPGTIFHFTAWMDKTDRKKVSIVAPSTLSGKRVLVVDDNIKSLNILTNILLSAGMDVTAINKEEDVLPALKKALGTKYSIDFCILDIKMPIINGYELAKQIRNVESSIRDLPLIALSNLLERENQKDNEENFDGFLHKPVRREKLYQILKNVLHKQEGKKGHRDAENPENRKHLKSTSSVQTEKKKHSCVLLAEDNLINQKLAKMMLTKAGYQVETADTGKNAVDKFISSSGKFDLVIMDMQMPEMDGIEATNLIRKWEEKNIAPSSKLKGEEKVDLSASNVELLPHVKRVPIVALTANAIKGDKEKCLDSGMDDYITKPIDRKIFFEVIEKWTSLNKSSQNSIQLD